MDSTPEGAEILNKPVVKPFPQSTPDDDEKDSKAGEAEKADTEDDNQPGFIGKRNLPHP